MPNATTVLTIPPAPSLETAWEDVHSSFERFCLTAGSFQGRIIVDRRAENHGGIQVHIATGPRQEFEGITLRAWSQWIALEGIEALPDAFE